MSPRRNLLGAGPLLLLVVATFLAWAALFELDQSVRAQGQLIPQARTQVIQVADGGVIQALKVNEGQHVRAGELLAVLEKQRASASVDEVLKRIAGLQAARLRALAEASGTEPAFGLLARTHPDVVAVQLALYRQNLAALADDVRSLQGALRLARDELELTARLVSSGDASRTEQMRAERQVLELQQRLDAARQKLRLDARREVARVEDELAAQQSRLEERQSVLGHTDITAPTDGIVKSLRVTTLGGVLRAGDELMQISPTENGYVIEARINPADIGQLTPDLPVTIRLDAFDYTVHGTLEGHLRYLSADTLTEQGPDGRATTFYRAHVEVDSQNHNPKLALAALKPGMTATLDVRTARLSVLTFLAKPVLRAFSGAFSQR